MIPEASQSDLAPGAHVCGDYVVERRVRFGPGIGVYAARRANHPTVRFTVWHVRDAATSDAAAIRRFQRAVEQIRSLTLQSIPAIVAATVAPAGPVIVTEYVDGVTLRDRMVGGRRLKRPEIIRVVRHVATVIDELHGCEPPVVHRALCPEHIRVKAPDGPVWVEACGFVHALASAGLIENPASAFVDAEYLTPDEHRGRVEPRGDIFALASLTFEMLTGQRAYAGADRVAIDARLLKGPRPSVCQLRPELSPETDPILMRAWSLNADGYANAWAFARDLTEALNAVPLTGMGAESAPPPAAPGAERGSVRPRAQDVSVVAPSPEVISATLPRALPNDDEIDRAFEAMLGPDDLANSGARPVPIALEQRKTDRLRDEEEGVPTTIFRSRPGALPEEDDPGERPTMPHTSSERPPPMRGGSAGSTRPPPMGSAGSVYPIPNGTPLRAATPPRGAAAPLRAPTPVPGSVRPPPSGSVLRAATLPGVRGAAVVSGATPPRGVPRVPNATPSHGMPRMDGAAARSALRAPSVPSVRSPAPEVSLPSGPGPGVGREGYGAFLQGPGDAAQLSPPAPAAAPAAKSDAGRATTNRGAVILGGCLVAAAAIVTGGQLYLARRGEAGRDARPGARGDLRGGARVAPLGPAPGDVGDAGTTDAGAATGDAAPGTEARGELPLQPASADVAAARATLDAAVRRCVADPQPRAGGTRVRVSVWFAGATGRADRVFVWGAHALPPAGPCIQDAARALALPRFSMGSFPADFTFALR